MQLHNIIMIPLCNTDLFIFIPLRGIVITLILHFSILQCQNIQWFQCIHPFLKATTMYAISFYTSDCYYPPSLLSWQIFLYFVQMFDVIKHEYIEHLLFIVSSNNFITLLHCHILVLLSIFHRLFDTTLSIISPIYELLLSVIPHQQA